MPTTETVHISVAVPVTDVAKVYAFVAGLWSSPTAIWSGPTGPMPVMASPAPVAPMAVAPTPLPAAPAPTVQTPVKGTIETPPTPVATPASQPQAVSGAASVAAGDPVRLNDPEVWRNCTNAKDVVDVIMNREGFGAFETVLARFKEVRSTNLCKAASVIPEDKVEARVKLNYQALGGSPF